MRLEEYRNLQERLEALEAGMVPKNESETQVRIFKCRSCGLYTQVKEW